MSRSLAKKPTPRFFTNKNPRGNVGLLRVVSNESIYRQTSLSNAPKLITVIGVNQIRLRATPNLQAKRRAVVLWIFLVPAHTCERLFFKTGVFLTLTAYVFAA